MAYFHRLRECHASAGSFAAISTLLGSPVLGAFLIMEAAGIGGMTLSLVALSGLLAYRRTVDLDHQSCPRI
jgi:hypothetical protein